MRSLEGSNSQSREVAGQVRGAGGVGGLSGGPVSAWEDGKAPEMTVATAARPRAVRDAPEPSPSKRLKWQLPR